MVLDVTDGVKDSGNVRKRPCEEIAVLVVKVLWFSFFVLQIL